MCTVRIVAFELSTENVYLCSTLLIIRDLKICDNDVNENVTSKYNFALS